MAIKKIHEEKNGVIGYVITKEEDLEKLPKNGIAITSRAILVNPTIGVKTYIFYDNDVDKNTDGEWIEWKAKYSGLGDNVKDYIKEYHEDLNKIVDITNPKIGEGYDVTINDSKEGVLSFEVNGRTLQNLAPKIVESSYSSSSVSIGTVEMFKPSTLYTIIYEIKGSETLEIPSNKVESMFRLEALNSNSIMKTVYGYNGTITTTYVQVKETFTTTSDIAKINFNVRNAFNDYNLTEYTLYIKNLVVLEGDYTNTPIETLPFVEGIQSVGENEVQEDGKYLISVKSIGKNLIDHSKWSKSYEATVIDNNDGSFILSSTEAWKGILFKDIVLKSNTTYTFNCNSTAKVNVFIRTKLNNGKYTSAAVWGGVMPYSFTTKNVPTIIQLSIEGTKVLDNVLISNLQLEEGSQATEYEPYQESTYNCLLDEPLRQLPNGVCDTIEKDKVVRRVGKTVLDDGIYWSFGNHGAGGTDTTMAETHQIRLKALNSKIGGMCDKIQVVTASYLWTYTKTETIISFNVDGAIHIRIKNDILDECTLAGFKRWIKANPVTVLYELAEPTTEQLPTIPTINSYNDVTHIYSTNYIQPFINIFDAVSIFKDANQYLNIECDRVFALPNMDDLEDNAVKEIHMYIYMKEEATLTFPSDIKWETLSEFGKGDYVEIILTYVKTNGVGQWLGSAIVYNS